MSKNSLLFVIRTMFSSIIYMLAAINTMFSVIHMFSINAKKSPMFTLKNLYVHFYNADGNVALKDVPEPILEEDPEEFPIYFAKIYG